MNKWKIFKYFVKGVNHSNSAPCQDYVDVEEHGDMLVAVLADGLGSKKHSEVAARSVVKTVKKLLLTKFDSFNGSGWFKNFLICQCRKQIAESASAIGYQVEDMDCTLLFAAFRDNKLVVGQLGDGAVCMLQKKCGALFCKPQKGNVVNSTMTLFSCDAVSALQINCYDISGLEAVILTSDGLEGELYYSNSKAVKKKAATYARVVSNETTTKAADIIGKRVRKLQSAGFDDDISIAVISKKCTVINLPDDPTWLCTCGKRNPIDITHCNNCSVDFIDIYFAQDFSRQDKAVFFRKFNGSAEEAKFIGQKENVIQSDHRKLSETEQQRGKIEGGSTIMPNRGFQKKWLVTAFYILICVTCFLLGYCINSLLDTSQADYDKLALLIHEFSQQSNQEAAKAADNDDDIIQKIDDLKDLIQQFSKNLEKESTVALTTTMDISEYRNILITLLKKYGDQDCMEFAPYGCKRYEDESYYIGEMHDGIENGKGVIFNEDGSLLIGGFVNGKKEGEFSCIDADGTYKIVLFTASARNGDE